MKLFIKTVITILAGWLFLQANAVTLPDYQKEQRWIKQIQDYILDGDMIMISGAHKDFAAIFTESENESNKAAIIIHGLGAHPNWAGVIHPLRVSLTTKGYNTLSVQMPVLANEVNSEEYIGLLPISRQRLAISVDYLETQGYEVDLIVAHSFGTTMVSHYLATTPHPFDKYIAVGANFHSVLYLPNIHTKLLDIYGSEDIDSVINSREARKNAAKHNKKYSLQMIEGDHFFTDKDENLINAVYIWLEQQ